MSKPLLEIRVDNMDSVPVVYYKGQKMEGKQRVKYDWHTRDDVDERGHHSIRLIASDPDAEQPGTIMIVHDRI